MIELLCRGWLLFSGLPQSPASLRAVIIERNSLLTEAIPTPDKKTDTSYQVHTGEIITYHPFIGFGPLHKLKRISQRALIFKTKDDPKRFDILVLGGSVAGRTANVTNRTLLIGRLKEDPRFSGLDINILPDAGGGYKQPQQVIGLAYLLSAGYKPDAVINIDGFNEVALGLYNAWNEVFPLYPSFSHWGRLVGNRWESPEMLDALLTIRKCQEQARWLTDWALNYRLYFSGILGHLVLGRFEKIGRNYATANWKFESGLTNSGDNPMDRAIKGPPFIQSDQPVMDSIAGAWIEASVSMKAMCDARSIPFVHVLQPTLHDEGAKPVTEEERRKGTAHQSWIRGVQLGYPMLRAAGPVLKARGIPFYDCSMIFKDLNETIYFDACHFRGKGNEIFATAVAEALLDVLNKHESEK